MVRWKNGALLSSIALDREVPRKLSFQICAGLRQLILAGSLEPGERLPATRTLAQDLGVARTTIVESFERLAAEGLLTARVGAGTYVSDRVHHERPIGKGRPTNAPGARLRLSAAMAAATPQFAARIAHPDRPFTTAMPAFDAFPMAQWSRIASKHWREDRKHVLGYPEPHGYKPLRKAIATHLHANRGIECDWRQIFVVAGAQQAFQLIAGTLADPQDKVWFENPGAIGARNSLVLSCVDLVPVPVDDHGLDVEAGLGLAPEFKLAFVTPAHQQPLGAKMSVDRRLALLRAADQSNAFIIEDDWDGEFSFSGRPLPPLRSLDTEGRVIYVGTFSKSLFPALRLGYMLAPPALTEHFGIILEAYAPSVPTALQALVAEFIDEGHFATHIRRMRKLYAERYEILRDGVASDLATWLDLTPTQSGLHTVAYLRSGHDADGIATAAAEQGVTVTPLSRFYLGPVRRQGFVLGFNAFSEPQLRAGMQSLRAVFKQADHARGRR